MKFLNMLFLIIFLSACSGTKKNIQVNSVSQMMNEIHSECEFNGAVLVAKNNKVIYKIASEF